MYESCGDTAPHDAHDYQVDGEWHSCAGIPTRTDYDF